MEIKEIICVSKVSFYSTNKTIRLRLRYKNKAKILPLYRGIHSLDMELAYEVMLAFYINETVGDFINNLESLKSLEEIELRLA